MIRRLWLSSVMYNFPYSRTAIAMRMVAAHVRYHRIATRRARSGGLHAVYCFIIIGREVH